MALVRIVKNEKYIDIYGNEYDVRVNNFNDRIYYKSDTNILHRLDGPAIENFALKFLCFYYLNDIEYSKEEWEYELLLPEEKLIKKLIE